MTTYVADSRGYRLVPSQGVITVYPKTGKPRKVSLLDDDPNDEGNIQYDFPDGCKGIDDVLIDNSSRLRNLVSIPAAASDMKHQIRLPVTQKPIPNVEYVYSTPSNYYVPPGPSNIYAPHLIMVSKPSTPSNSYLPPLEISIPSTPGNTYLPPVEESTEIITEETDSSNLIDHETTVDPNEMSQETTAPSNHYLPPNEPSTGPPSNMYLPPQTGIIQEIVPPKEEVKECPDTLSCCDDSNSGKFIIPIPLKKQNANECCTGVAKLILPVYNFDVDSIRKLKETIPAEIDATELIKNILQNLV